jgi:DNA-binding response OmpR family regulator
MRAALAEQPFDLVLLDVRLPGEDGFSLARWLREHSDVAIVMLTAKDDLIDRVAGLESGADDYVPKPFHPRELLARTRAVLRRTCHRSSAETPSEPTRKLHFAGFCLDLERRSLSDAQGEDINLSPTEFELLQTLASQPDKALSREQLMDLVHGRELQMFDRAIDMHISHLRKKLENGANGAKLIHTVRGVGYRFSVDG